jgi:hypothetical protein
MTAKAHKVIKVTLRELSSYLYIMPKIHDVNLLWNPRQTTGLTNQIRDLTNNYRWNPLELD